MNVHAGSSGGSQRATGTRSDPAPRPTGSTAVEPATRHRRGLWLAIYALLAATIFAALSTMTADTDLWGHLRFGGALWQSGHLERSDPYAFTSGAGWINHEWLAELIMYLSYRAGGDLALLALKLAIGVATVLLIVASCRRRGAPPLIVALVVPIAVFALKPGFMFRPQVFSYVLFAATLTVLGVGSASGGRRLIWLPILMAMWVNLHGGFLIGCAVVAIVVLAESVAEGLHPQSSRELGRLWLAAVGAALATLASPYGWELHRFLLRSLTVSRPIGEWAPLPLLDDSYPEVKILLLATIVIAIWLAAARRLRLPEALVLGLTAVAMLQHQRHAPFFVIAAAPFVADGITRLSHHPRIVGITRAGSDGAMRVMVAGLLVVAVAEVATASYALAVGRGRIFVDPELYPVAATDFLAKNHATGRLLLPFEWGEYAIWHLYPSCLVSVDGRFRTVYPERVLDDHYLAAADPGRWPVLMSSYRADLAMIPRSVAVDELARRGVAGWLTVHVDPLAVVLVRTDGADSALADAARRRALVPADDPPDVFFP